MTKNADDLSASPSPFPAENEGVEEQANPPIQARMISQYVKDLSYESPNIPMVICGAGDQPILKVDVNVRAVHVASDFFESHIDFKAIVTNSLGTLYVLEVLYAGLSKIDSIPERALERFLLISGPTMLFPFLRRLVAEVTREGGFPPLLLDPIDFGALYFRKEERQDKVGPDFQEETFPPTPLEA